MNNKTNKKKRLGIVDERGDFYVTAQGGKIGREVPLDNIAEGTQFLGGTVVLGRHTRIEKGAVLEGAFVQNAYIGQRARIAHSIVRTSSNTDIWCFHSETPYQVRGTAAFISEGARVADQSIVENSFIGPGTAIHSASLVDSRIGGGNLVAKAKIHLVHSEDGVCIQGPTEVCESYLGGGFFVDRCSYIEGIFTNEIIAAEYTNDGGLTLTLLPAIPHLSLIGERVIFSGYSGTMAPPAEGVVSEITGGEKSRHGTPVVAPFSVMCSELRLIGLPAHPLLTNPRALLAERDITYLMPFSVTGFTASEHWGWALPGELSTGLSPVAGMSPWTFDHAPDLIFHFIASGVKRAPHLTALFDELPETMLRTGMALTRYLIEQENKKTSLRREALIQRGRRINHLKIYVSAYKRHLASGAWGCRNGEPLAFTFDKTKKRWGSQKIKLPARQYLLGDFTHAECALDEYRKKDLVKRPVLFQKAPQGKGVAAATEEEGFVQKKTWAVSADTKTRISADARCYGAVCKGACINGRSLIANARIVRSTLEGNVSATCAAIIASHLGDACRVEPGAYIEKTRAAKGAIIGSPCFNSEIAGGVTDHHLASHIDGLVSPEICFYFLGERQALPNTTNIGAGTAIVPPHRKYTGARAVCESAFLCSNSIIEQGARIGFASFVKGRVLSGEHLPPFTFRNNADLKSKNPHRDDTIGGVLLYPEILFRHIISKTKKSTGGDAHKAADRLIEAKLLEALSECIKAILASEAGGTGYSISQLEAGLGRYLNALDGRWRLRDGVFTDGVWRSGEAGSHFTWQPRPFIGSVSAETVRQYLDKKKLPRSFSGVRAAFGLGPVAPELRLIGAMLSYQYARILKKKLLPGSLNRKKILVAHDGRLSGPDLAEASIRGALLGFGAHHEISIVKAGVLTTPLLEQAVRSLRADGAIMITGSHNPMEQNGVKFATGYKPYRAGERVYGGALLAAGEMNRLIEGLEEQLGGEAIDLETFRKKVNRVDVSKRKVSLVKGSDLRRLKADYIRFIRASLCLDEEALAQCRRLLREKGTAIVLDTAGGSAAPFYPGILSDLFGIEPLELAPQLGQSRPKIEPTGEGLAPLLEALGREKDAIGIATDCDADRGNLIIKEPGTKPFAIEAQTLSALNTALFLSWLDYKGKLKDRTAVVTNDATSLRIRDIAETFGVETYSVEVGEINLLEKAEELRAKGYLVPFLTEGSNGGAIFGDSKVRDGLMSLVFSLMIISQPQGVLGWLVRRGVKLTQKQKHRISKGRYTLSELLGYLPQYHSLAERIEGREAALDQRILKCRMEEELFSRFWDSAAGRLSASFYEFLKANGARTTGITSYRIIYHQALSKECPFVASEPSQEFGVQMKDPAGGWRIEFLDRAQRPAGFIWLRGSRTEPGNIFNIMADSPSKNLTAGLFAFLEYLYRTANG
ncbi:MAG: hypothetical protein JW844_04070 [Candidatus Omnitrophica bacterium]|nr:hypothetical protein [Candidatus Omnitrophota bacterium]